MSVTIVIVKYYIEFIQLKSGLCSAITSGNKLISVYETDGHGRGVIRRCLLGNIRKQMIISVKSLGHSWLFYKYILKNASKITLVEIISPAAVKITYIEIK